MMAGFYLLMRLGVVLGMSEVFIFVDAVIADASVFKDPWELFVVRRETDSWDMFGGSGLFLEDFSWISRRFIHFDRVNRTHFLFTVKISYIFLFYFPIFLQNIKSTYLMPHINTLMTTQRHDFSQLFLLYLLILILSVRMTAIHELIVSLNIFNAKQSELMILIHNLIKFIRTTFGRIYFFDIFIELVFIKSEHILVHFQYNYKI